MYQKGYTGFGNVYQLILTLNLEGLIPSDESVRLLSHKLAEYGYFDEETALQIQQNRICSISAAIWL